MENLPAHQFIPWFRSVAPYIHAHKGKTFVIGVTGDLIAAGRLNALVHDLALIQSLNIKIVLVHGFRSQIEEQLKAKGIESRYEHGIRITDENALICAQEVAGRLRYQIEAAFSQALPNTPMAHAKVCVLSGNFITAKPLGIVNGVDYQHTGVIRKLDTAGIHSALAQDGIVLLSPFGYSLTGEAFNLTMEEIATYAAVSLKADKLIFMAKPSGICKSCKDIEKRVEKTKACESIPCWSPIEHELSLRQARDRLAEEQNKPVSSLHVNYLQFAVDAVAAGVQRAHIIPYAIDGGLLKELFTHHGLGTMVVDEKLENLRQATPEDIGAIIQMIEPLEKQDVLVKRSRTEIERDITAYSVIEHDGVIFGCAAFYPYADEKTAELAAVAISKDAQGHGDGDRLLKHIEQRALQLGLTSIFVLTTQTMHWFIKRGFKEVKPEWLPASRQEEYNWERRSQVLVKHLEQTA